MKIVALESRKGGTGKTSACMNLAVFLATPRRNGIAPVFHSSV